MTLTSTSSANNASYAVITVSPAKQNTNNIYKYYLDTFNSSGTINIENYTYGQDLNSWTTWDGESEIETFNGHTLIIAECDNNGKLLKIGAVLTNAEEPGLP